MSQTLTIIGQGYVGLPLAQAAVHAGWKVTGFDLSERVVSGLNSGKSHIDDLSDDEISEMLLVTVRHQIPGSLLKAASS